MSDQKYRVISPKGKWKFATRERIITARESGRLPEDCEVLIYERAESLASFCSGQSSKPKKDPSPADKQLNSAAELGVVVPHGESHVESHVESHGDVSRSIGEATAECDDESLTIIEHAKRKMESNSETLDDSSRLTMAMSLMDELTIE